MEGASLDLLLKVRWPKALQGDHRALDEVIRIHDRRVRLLGLEWGNLGATVGVETRTLVMPR